MSQYIRYPVVAGDGVESIFGRTGTVVAATNDYTWAQIDKTISSLNDITTRLLSPAAAVDVGLTIKGHASQSGDLLDITDSSNVPLLTIDSSGQVAIPNAGNNQGLTITSTGGFSLLGITHDGTAVQGNADSGGFGVVGYSGSGGTGVIAETATGIAAEFLQDDPANVVDCVQIIDNSTTGMASTKKMLNIKNATDLGQTSVFSVTLAGTVTGANINKIALLSDQKTSGTDGGTFTGGARRTRDLNTESDPSGIVTLAANQFTLAAGSYLIDWTAPASQIDSHKSFLSDITNAVDVGIGSSELSDAAAFEVTQSSSFGSAIVNPAGTTVYEIQHISAGTKASVGFGRAGALGTEVYTQVKITKLS